MMINLDRHICKAKDIQTGEWVYGYYFERKDIMGNIIESVIIEDAYEQIHGGRRLLESMFNKECFRVDPETVCQYTGWHDSSKTSIFEKDIVEFVGPNTHRDLIWWCNEMSEMTAIPVDGIEFNGYDFWNGKYPKANYSSFCLMMQDPYGDFKEIKVVGNIIDNPELLE